MRDRLLATLCFVIFVGCGVALFTWADADPTKEGQFVTAPDVTVFGAALILAWLPPVAGGLKRASDWMERLPPRRHGWAVVGFGLLLIAHFLIASQRGGRLWVPQLHDEQMYLLQARQLASFHLAMPALPLPDFFDTFYVLTHPKYASMYFPGTALAYVPAVWLHLPWVVWPLLITAGSVIVTYLVASRLLGRLLGLMAALCYMATDGFNWLPTMTMSHPLGALQGMTILYGWLRWRERPGAGWAVLIGAVGGWMAITRPLESLVFGLPVLVAMLGRTRSIGVRQMAIQAAAAFAVAAPFLGTQLAFDYAVTGSISKLPITLYVEQEFPGMSTMGATAKGADVKSISTLPQKRAMTDVFVRPMLQSHFGESLWQGLAWRLRMIFLSGMTNLLLLIFIFLSLPLSRRRPEWRVLWAVAALFVLGYRFYGTYVVQYSIQVAPVLALLVLGGAVWLHDAFPHLVRQIRAGYVLVGGMIALETLAIMPNVGLSPFDWDTLEINYHVLPKIIKPPALLFVKFHDDNNPHVEMVYNIDVAWPDDAPIVRMHDFGGVRNLPALEYYARIQPDRAVYEYDRDTRKLTPFGNVIDVIANIRNQPGTTRPTSMAATRPE